MSKIYTYITRGKYDESIHEAKCLVKNSKNEIIKPNECKIGETLLLQSYPKEFKTVILSNIM